MSNQQAAETLLAAWREAERELERATPESADAEDLQAEVARLHDRYQQLVAALTERHDRDDPSPRGAEMEMV